MDKKLKEGVTVQELENFSKKYRFEIFFILYFLLATLFSFFSYFTMGWNVMLAGLGGILGVWMPAKIQKAIMSGFQFVFKQEKVTKLIIGIFGLVVSILLTPLVFFFLGLVGGTGTYLIASKVAPIHKDEGGGGQ